MQNVYSFLRGHRDEIVRAWEARVQSETRPVELADALLRNHIPELLDELADWMERGEPAGGAEMRVAAATHALQRVENAFQVAQLIHEVGLLRTTILSLLLAEETAEQGRSGTRLMAARVVELARLNTGLDSVMTDGVESFVEERERRLAEMASREAALARESDQRKSDFLAVLSHELRNPLAPISTGLHILERAEPGSATAARAREVIHRQTEHLTRLVDDLLDATRISSGKVELQRERIDLREVVRRTCDDQRALFEQRTLDLRLEAAGGPIWIDGDATRLSQVLSNLLLNAAKFTGVGGAVSVTVAADAGRASLRVKDSGVGMEQNTVERIFEPFVQVKQDPARQLGGLGLGLALVKGFVDLHGGAVSATSAGLGRGAEFIVELPLAPAPVTAPRGPARPATPPRLVLIIEDNDDAAEMLAETLALGGHLARIARDGRSGIALARELRPDVVLCDIGLPDVDGYEVARLLRGDGGLPGTRLVAISGYAQPEDRKRAQQAGFDAHLAKPPPLEELNEILAKAPRGAAGRQLAAE